MDELRCPKGGPAAGGPPVACRLTLAGGAVDQVLAGFELAWVAGTPEPALGDDPSPHLLWAGDLDGDCRPDPLLDLTDHYNLALLWLSSEAEAGDLVGLAAERRYPGC
jgi:hypothetical protein